MALISISEVFVIKKPPPFIVLLFMEMDRLF